MRCFGGDLDESPPVSDDGLDECRGLRQGWVISVLACVRGERGMLIFMPHWDGIQEYDG